jgi:hypothetical protein
MVRNDAGVALPEGSVTGPATPHTPGFRTTIGTGRTAASQPMRDFRCSMVNPDPDSASPAPEVLKAVVRANQNNAGTYGAVIRIGRLAVGQTLILQAPGRTISECGVAESLAFCRSSPFEQTEK